MSIMPTPARSQSPACASAGVVESVTTLRSRVGGGTDPIDRDLLLDTKPHLAEGGCRSQRF